MAKAIFEEEGVWFTFLYYFANIEQVVFVFLVTTGLWGDCLVATAIFQWRTAMPPPVPNLFTEMNLENLRPS